MAAPAVSFTQYVLFTHANYVKTQHKSYFLAKAFLESPDN